MISYKVWSLPVWLFKIFRPPLPFFQFEFYFCRQKKILLMIWKFIFKCNTAAVLLAAYWMDWWILIPEGKLSKIEENEKERKTKKKQAVLPRVSHLMQDRHPPDIITQAIIRYYNFLSVFVLLSSTQLLVPAHFSSSLDKGERGLLCIITRKTDRNACHVYWHPTPYVLLWTWNLPCTR